MTSWQQWQANRLNALKSTGPRTEEGRRISRRNAIRHGLTAETVIDGLENSGDYRGFEAAIIADYDADTAVERELVLRLSHRRGRRTRHSLKPPSRRATAASRPAATSPHRSSIGSCPRAAIRASPALPPRRRSSRSTPAPSMPTARPSTAVPTSPLPPRYRAHQQRHSRPLRRRKNALAARRRIQGRSIALPRRPRRQEHGRRPQLRSRPRPQHQNQGQHQARRKRAGWNPDFLLLRQLLTPPLSCPSDLQAVIWWRWQNRRDSWMKEKLSSRNSARSTTRM
jgi:hypothetical protein